jgi:hypothetical protein
MSAIKKLADLGRDLAAAVRSASADVATLRGRIRAKRAERDVAKGAPCPPDEVVVRFEAWVDQVGAWWRTKAGADLVMHVFGAAADPRAPSHWGPNDVVRWGELCGLAAPMLKREFGELVRATAYVAGPASAARPAIVERLDRELAELETAEESLIDQAAAAGVAIAHRPEVLERREAERLKRDRAAAAELARLAREAVPAARPEEYRAGRSQYISPR